MSPRSETMQLYKQFLRLRHMFPNKQGRSTLRRWTSALFSLRQLEYDTLATRSGKAHADRQAAEWRAHGRDDLDLWTNLAAGSEEGRRALIRRVLSNSHTRTLFM